MAAAPAAGEPVVNDPGLAAALVAQMAGETGVLIDAKGKEAEPAKKDGEADPAKAAEPPKDGEADPAKKAAEGEPVVFELKTPEGFEALDADALKAATPILAELGVKDSAQAQAVVDRFAKDVLAPMIGRATDGANARIMQQVADTRQAWVDTSLKDPEYGNVGKEAFDANMSLAARARDQFGTPEFQSFLKETGLANHPEMIRFCYRVGKAISEDVTIIGDGSAQQGKAPLEERMYDPAFHKK